MHEECVHLSLSQSEVSLLSNPASKKCDVNFAARPRIGKLLLERPQRHLAFDGDNFVSLLQSGRARLLSKDIIDDQRAAKIASRGEAKVGNDSRLPLQLQSDRAQEFVVRQFRRLSDVEIKKTAQIRTCQLLRLFAHAVGIGEELAGF